MLPVFKECVEELFSRGLVKIVFATETLALGINMPARSVVIDKLSKWNGETHADVTPGEYTQLTGRAGRRGIDVEGHAVVLWAPGLDPKAVAGLASTRTYPLRSSFRPSYNMAVNLVRQVGRDTARELLESSFAQFQADRAVVGLARQVRKARGGAGRIRRCDGLRPRRLHRVRRAASRACRTGRPTCRGGVRRTVGRPPSSPWRSSASETSSTYRPAIGRVCRRGRSRTALGLGRTAPARRHADRQARRLSLVDFPTPVEPVTRMRVAKTFNARNPQQRRDLAAAAA